jgi:hypothetical protein
MTAPKQWTFLSMVVVPIASAAESSIKKEIMASSNDASSVRPFGFYEPVRHGVVVVTCAVHALLTPMF